MFVTVVDGDQSVRIPGAAVELAGRRLRTDRNGVVAIRVARRRSLHITVRAHGYSTRTVLASFLDSRRTTVRVFQPQLQWPIYGATPDRSQAQTHIRIRPPFRTVWSVDLGGLLEFPAVVDQGVAFIGNAQAQIHAISMRFGTILWTHDTPNGQMASSPAVIGQSLLYHTMDGHVYALDRSNGTLRWTYDVGSPIESSPVVVDDIDYFGAWNGTLYALDLGSHRLLWQRRLGAKVTASVSVAGNSLYVGDYSGRLWALKLQDGSTRWSETVNGRIYGTSAVSAGRVFVPSSDGDSLTALTTRGRYLWRISTGAYVYSSPAAWHDRVFFGSYNGVFYGADAATGQIVWHVNTGGPISGAAVVVDGVAYAGSFAHHIVGVSALSGRVVLDFKHGHYVPVSGNGMRLLLHGYSSLYAVEPLVAAPVAHR